MNRLPNLANIKPTELGFKHHPYFRRQPQTLLRQIDFEQRTLSPLLELTCGSTILVKQEQGMFAGILMEQRKKGIMSSILLMSNVMGVKCTKRFQVYNPALKIVVLQKGGLKQDNILPWLTDKSKAMTLDFAGVETVLMKYKNQQ